jgi:hypothetical protein
MFKSMDKWGFTKERMMKRTGRGKSEGGGDD